MEWRHILFEGNCLFFMNNEDSLTKPSCCYFEPGKVGLHCLKYDLENNKFCSYLGIGTAKSSLVVSDNKGDVVGGTCFFDESDLSSEEWESSERKWVKKQLDYINGLSSH